MKIGDKFFVRTMVIPICLLVFAGCASIISGTKQDVTISSSPGSANIVIKSSKGIEVFRGATPVRVELKRKYSYQVSIALPGYREENVYIDNNFNAWYLGNIICGGLIGLVIDAINGAMYTLEPDMISVSLVTAYAPDGSRGEYAVFRALDDLGQLRVMFVPLIKS